MTKKKMSNQSITKNILSIIVMMTMMVILVICGEGGSGVMGATINVSTPAPSSTMTPLVEQQQLMGTTLALVPVHVYRNGTIQLADVDLARSQAQLNKQHEALISNITLNGERQLAIQLRNRERSKQERIAAIRHEILTRLGMENRQPSLSTAPTSLIFAKDSETGKKLIDVMVNSSGLIGANTGVVGNGDSGSPFNNYSPITRTPFLYPFSTAMPASSSSSSQQQQSMFSGSPLNPITVNGDDASSSSSSSPSAFRSPKPTASVSSSAFAAKSSGSALASDSSNLFNFGTTGGSGGNDHQINNTSNGGNGVTIENDDANGSNRFRDISTEEIYAQRLQSFYPSCGVPNFTDAEVWRRPNQREMKFYFDVSVPKSSKPTTTATAVAPTVSGISTSSSSSLPSTYPRSSTHITVMWAKLRVYIFAGPECVRRNGVGSGGSGDGMQQKQPQQISPSSSPTSSSFVSSDPITTYQDTLIMPQCETNTITVSLYQYVRPLRKNSAERRRMLDSRTIPAIYRGYIEFNMQSVIAYWQNLADSNYGLMIRVEDAFGTSLPPSLYIQPMNCSDPENIAIPNLAGLYGRPIFGTNDTKGFLIGTQWEQRARYPTLDLMTMVTHQHHHHQQQ